MAFKAVELSVVEGAKAMAEVAIMAETATAKDFILLFFIGLCVVLYYRVVVGYKRDEEATRNEKARNREKNKTRCCLLGTEVSCCCFSLHVVTLKTAICVSFFII
jgi:hypothetical protein